MPGDNNSALSFLMKGLIYDMLLIWNTQMNEVTNKMYDSNWPGHKTFVLRLLPQTDYLEQYGSCKMKYFKMLKITE